MKRLIVACAVSALIFLVALHAAILLPNHSAEQKVAAADAILALAVAGATGIALIFSEDE